MLMQKVGLLVGILMMPLELVAANNLPTLPPEFQLPNLFEFNGNSLHITYATTGIDGRPHFTYQDNKQTLNFSGDQIRRIGTELGTLISVTINMTVDTGSTSFTLLVPNVKLDHTLEAPIKSEGITTQHKFSVIPTFNVGQTDTYKFTQLSGIARFVHF